MYGTAVVRCGMQDFVADGSHDDVDSDDASQDEDDNDHEDSSILPLYSGDTVSPSDEPRSPDDSRGDDNTAVGSDFTFEPSSSAADDDAAADQSTSVLCFNFLVAVNRR